MDESNEALEKVSTEVEKSQNNIIVSTTCIKAQALLYDKLKKECESLKEICTFISSSNSKLETEIQFAEQEIKSLNLDLETIRVGKIEIQKAYFISQERKADTFKRIKNGIQKYESIWAKSKEKYENIPCVKKMIEAKNKSLIIQTNIDTFINESKDLAKKIKKKRRDLNAIDLARIVEMAVFFVHEKPKILKRIDEKNKQIKELTQKIQTSLKQQKHINTIFAKEPVHTEHKKKAVEIIKEKSVDDNKSNQSKNIDKDTLTWPSLHLHNNDLDILSIELDEIKKLDLQNISSSNQKTNPCKSFDIENDSHKEFNAEITKKFNISSCYNVIGDAGDNEGQSKSMNYSDKKLIHIIDNVRLDIKDTFNIMHKLEPQQFQSTKYITPKIIKNPDSVIVFQEKLNKSIEIEEIDLTTTEHKYEAGATPSQFVNNSQMNRPIDIEQIDFTSEEYRYEAVAPPSQFVDNKQSSQEKKTVTFSISKEEKLQKLSEGDLSKSLENFETEVKSQEKLINVSATSEDNYTTIKDMILKKHNLDLSPQFVYAKNTLQQKPSDEQTVTSKFFVNKAEMNFKNEDIKENIENQPILKNNTESVTNDDMNLKMKQNVDIGGEPITGLLFNHGPEGITESLNISISTTGFNDSEDFPHCIDANVMLSPKADIPGTAASTGNNEVMSQEVPNFLAGFRKKGLSMFGFSSTSNQEPDSSAQNQNKGFNFNFGGEEKKDRGGLFSMFH